MPKIRAMRVDTPAVATHLMRNPDPQISQIKFIAQRRRVAKRKRKEQRTDDGGQTTLR